MGFDGYYTLTYGTHHRELSTYVVGCCRTYICWVSPLDILTAPKDAGGCSLLVASPYQPSRTHIGVAHVPRNARSEKTIESSFRWARRK